MKKIYLVILAAILLIIGVALAVINNARSSQVCFGEKCFNVEIADDADERARGLMFRENLEEDRGMLFIFEESGIYPFWMKNTKIPLDMIWIDENLDIVFVAENVLPCEEEPCPSINPQTSAKFVLEINAGLSEEMGIEIGDSADFTL